MSNVYSMIATLLGASLFRILEIGVNQSAGFMASSAYAWLLTLNPIIVIILGVIVFIAGKLAKWVGLIMIIVGVIFLALSYLLHLIYESFQQNYANVDCPKNERVRSVLFRIEETKPEREIDD